MTFEKTTIIAYTIILLILLIITIIPVIIMYNKYEKAKSEIYILKKRNAEQINFYNHIINEITYKNKNMQEDFKKYRMYKKWYENRKKIIKNKS